LVCQLPLNQNHVECLEIKHEHSLTMTIVKRHALSTGRVTNKLEVYTTLKSLLVDSNALEEEVPAG
jgi:hypothetical protein